MSYLESVFSLAGKTAVVIGGTGELCGAMAQCMAEAGAEVVLVGRSLEKAEKRLAAIEAAGGKAFDFDDGFESHFFRFPGAHQQNGRRHQPLVNLRPQ